MLGSSNLQICNPRQQGNRNQEISYLETCQITDMFLSALEIFNYWSLGKYFKITFLFGLKKKIRNFKLEILLVPSILDKGHSSCFYI